MAHPDQFEFCRRCQQLYPGNFNNAKVLEIGSLDINGSIRPLFNNCHYIGIDCNSGKSVDCVCVAHEYHTDIVFDTICSAEAFEHDPFFIKTIERIFQLLKPGGLFFGTCASQRRLEHGTNKVPDMGMTYGPQSTHYANITPKMMSDAILIANPSAHIIHIELKRNDEDLYFYAIK